MCLGTRCVSQNDQREANGCDHSWVMGNAIETPSVLEPELPLYSMHVHRIDFVSSRSWKLHDYEQCQTKQRFELMQQRRELFIPAVMLSAQLAFTTQRQILWRRQTLFQVVIGTFRE